MSPFDQAWMVLKTDFLLDKERAMQEYGLDLDNMPIETPAFFNYSTTGDSEGLVNLNHEMWPIMAPGYNIGYAKFGERYDPETGEHRNMSWDNYDHTINDEGLAGEVMESLAHEGTHEAIQNTPEMIEAYKNAKEQAKLGNVRPLVELKLVHELMASRDNAHEALAHPMSFYRPSEEMDILDEARAKIREQRRKAGRA